MTLFFTMLLFAQAVDAQCPLGLKLKYQIDVDSFPIKYPNCTDFSDGYLHLGAELWEPSSDIDNLAPLSQLVSIKGFDISFVPGLASLEGLSNLESVMSLTIHADHSLENLLGMPKLKAVRYLEITYNNKMQNLEGLEGLDTLENAVISQNSVLSSLFGLNNLTSVADYLILSDNNVTSLSDLNNLESVGRLEISRSKVVSLSGLSSLTTCTGNILMEDNDDLQNLVGLEGLSSVGGNIYILSDSSFTSFQGLENLTTVGGGLGIHSNPVLTNLGGLENIISLNGDLIIGSNASLSSLEALGNLGSMNGNLKISGNPALSSLEGLENINPQTIGPKVWIYDNSELTTCAISSICGVFALPDKDIDIHDNGVGCSSIAEFDCNQNLPDLVASNLSDLPTQVDAGSQFSFSFDLNNQGTITSTDSFKIGVFLSYDDAFNAGDILVKEVSVGEVGAGVMNNISTVVDVPSNILIGGYYLLLKVDVDDNVSESNESNNLVASPSIIKINSAVGTECSPTILMPGQLALSENSTEYNLVGLYAHGGNNLPSVPAKRVYAIDKALDAATFVSDEIRPFYQSSMFNQGDSIIFRVLANLDGDTLWIQDIPFQVPPGKQLLDGLNSIVTLGVNRTADAIYLSGPDVFGTLGQPEFYFYIIKLDLEGNFIFQHSIEGNSSNENTTILDAKNGGYYVLHKTSVSKVSSMGQREWTRKGGYQVPSFMGESKDGEYAYFNWDDNENGQLGQGFLIENLKLSDFVSGEYISNLEIASNSVDPLSLLPSSVSEGFIDPGSDVIGHAMTDDGGIVLFLKVFDRTNSSNDFSPRKLFAVRLNASLDLVWFSDISSIWFDIPSSYPFLSLIKCVGIHTDDSSFVFALRMGQTVVFRKMTDDGVLLSSCQPDLLLSDVTGLPANTTAGTQIGLNFNLLNSGDSSAVNSYDVKIYLSQDDAFSGDDVLLSSIVQMATPVGAVSLGESIIIPESTVTGDYYILFIVDSENTVVESNETNNMISVPISIEGLVSADEAEEDAIRLAYPNPAVDFLTVNISSRTARKSIINIYDGRGQLLLSGKRYLVQGVSEVTIDVSGLPVGTYFVKEAGAKSYQSFVIMR